MLLIGGDRGARNWPRFRKGPRRPRSCVREEPEPATAHRNQSAYGTDAEAAIGEQARQEQAEAYLWNANAVRATLTQSGSITHPASW